MAGWINVVLAAVVMLATLPGRTQGLGLITEPMLRDLQIDRVTYASINLWATLLGAAILSADRPHLRHCRSSPHDMCHHAGAGRDGVGDERTGRRSVRPVPVCACDADVRSERALGRQHYRGGKVLQSPRWGGDGRLRGLADRVHGRGVHFRRDVGAGEWLADRMGASGVGTRDRGTARVAVARSVGTRRIRSR